MGRWGRGQAGKEGAEHSRKEPSRSRRCAAPCWKPTPNSWCVWACPPRRGISIERVAINVDDSPGLDNDGQQPVDEPIVPDGPAAYFSTLPIKRCAAAVQQAGIYSEISLTAGTFVCNHVFYGLMHLLATEDKQRRGGFIHVPHTPEMPAVLAYGVPSMAVDTATEGLRIVLTTVAEHDTDIKVPWGTTS
ncbi:hypothetical protein AB0L35_11340 [Streptomyces sp. NPDC052309]|uniref:pyroglutamyl-peptidase I family protein n=1 Tax=Streptomyces sp. NPDC052309 TaxID=3155421 RepID=UPI00344195F5